MFNTLNIFIIYIIIYIKYKVKYFLNNFCLRPGTSLNLARKAGEVTMVKITLYNIGEYKKKQVFYCFVGFFCIRIPNIKKVSRRHVFGYKNTSASMLREYKKEIPYGNCIQIQSSQFKCYAKYITAQHQAIYPIKSTMASPCKAILKIISKYFLCSCV